jgi:peptidyl-prolyl cis-trans isomerase C
MKPGETSGVVKSKDGFYIIKVVDKKAEKKQTLDEVRPRIERTLKQSMQKEVYDKYLESLKKKYPVKIMD